MLPMPMLLLLLLCLRQCKPYCHCRQSKQTRGRKRRKADEEVEDSARRTTNQTNRQKQTKPPACQLHRICRVHPPTLPYPSLPLPSTGNKRRLHRPAGRLAVRPSYLAQLTPERRRTKHIRSSTRTQCRHIRGAATGTATASTNCAFVRVISFKQQKAKH
ncbi:hypothetical protein IWX90DRAFT_619 [Phyllosticta citrichinensis]|uniref:Secreted protein n=1 Tax=Phyllosticta citrichinensis TaxID=1130410 RepID=A0ABR1Y578_9PEZI